MMEVARQATIGIGIVFTIVFLCIIAYVAFASEEEEEGRQRQQARAAGQLF